MKPAPFEYRRPETLAEALKLLAEDETRPLAGGQSLIPLLAMRLSRPRRLVDLQAIPELQALTGNRFGAMVTNARLEAEAGLPPLVAAALPQIGHWQIRTRGTVGGSLAHMDPAAEWPALALALDAVIIAASARRGERRIPAAELPRGPLTTSLAEDELLLGVELPEWTRNAPWHFEEVARRAGDFALVGVAAIGPPAGRPRIAVFGAGPVPVLIDPDHDARQQLQPASDVHASAAYRSEIAARLVERALEAIAN